MNPSYSEFRFPEVQSQSWKKVFPAKTPKEALSFISKLLKYEPEKRLNPTSALLHPFFNDLRL